MMLLAPVILLWQCVIWLGWGSWPALTARDALNWIGVSAPLTGGWFDKLTVAVMETPLSLAVVLGGALICVAAMSIAGVVGKAKSA